MIFGWMHCREVYTVGSTPEFWEAEAFLSTVERLKARVNTGVSYLRGGDSIVRTDASDYTAANCVAINTIGAHSIVAVSRNRPPFPWIHTSHDGDNSEQLEVGFQNQLDVRQAVVGSWTSAADGHVGIALTCPAHHPSQDLPDSVSSALTHDQTRAARDLRYRLGVGFI
jgi:5-methylthioadenosine/S-adenosylhomocysteine deaminase